MHKVRGIAAKQFFKTISEFYEIDNGHMLKCYPDRDIHYNYELLKMLKEL